MSRKIIRRLLTEAVQGSEIKIQRMPSIGYLIVNDQGAETVVKDEIDLINVLRSFKETGIKFVKDAISGEHMPIDLYIEMYGQFTKDFNEEQDDYNPLSPDSVMTSPDYIPEPDTAMDFNEELEDDIDFADAPTDDLDEYI